MIDEFTAHLTPLLSLGPLRNSENIEINMMKRIYRLFLF